MEEKTAERVVLCIKILLWIDALFLLAEIFLFRGLFAAFVGIVYGLFALNIAVIIGLLIVALLWYFRISWARYLAVLFLLAAGVFFIIISGMMLLIGGMSAANYLSFASPFLGLLGIVQFCAAGFLFHENVKTAFEAK